jgi:hypothetical protein
VLYSMWTDISVVLPFAFQGLQTGIGSWFRANHPMDSTNGNSWCDFKYKDYTPGFAIDMAQMTNNTHAVWGHPKWGVFGTQYCGLEAKVYNPKTGITIMMYVVDGFDSKWVRTPGSIDIMLKSYYTLIGKETLNKNEVIPYLQWQFTGNRNPQYIFGGPGDKF